MLISIVIPVFREEKNLRVLLERLDAVTTLLPEISWAYIFVNDGSPDDSMSVLREMSISNPRVGAIDFSRNFGKEVALTAGVHAAKDSDAVICMDADLQHPPEVIPVLVEKWRDGYEVVATIRSSTEKKSLTRRVASTCYYWLMSRISGVEIKSQSTDFRLFDKKVVKAFCRLTERERMFRGMVDWLGFKKTFVEFSAGARLHGEVSYSLQSLWKLAINSITAFSLFPLRLTGYLGVAITTVSTLLILWMMFQNIFVAQEMFRPSAFFAVFNTMMIGVVLMAIGLVALYIGNIHIEVINRPLYIVRDTINIDVDTIE